MILFVIFRESADSDIIECMHTVEVPVEACNKDSPCRYKYCVIMDVANEFMNSPFELISGTTKDGKTMNIDHLLVLNECIKAGGSSYNFSYVIIYL